VLRQAYAESLEPYHSWILRQTFTVFLSAVPSYESLLRLLSPGLGDVEREAVVLNDVRIYIYIYIYIYVYIYMYMYICSPPDWAT